MKFLPTGVNPVSKFGHQLNFRLDFLLVCWKLNILNAVRFLKEPLASFPGSPGTRIFIHACTTSMFAFRSVGAWERG